MGGKVLGSIVGLIVGLAAQSWWAAGIFCLVGLVAGHFYDQLHRPAESEPLSQSFGQSASVDPGPLPEPQTRAELEQTARRHFADHLCALFAAVAQADGDASRDEVHVVREYFEETLRYPKRELERVRLALKSALGAPVDLDGALQACREELPPPDRLALLSALYELALADGQFRRSERDVLDRIAQGLEITQTEQRSVRALHFPDGEAHYARLGLDAAATDDEVKSAFRKLAAAHHPDRVAHLGGGAMDAASRRFREIKDAYDAIRQLRGL